MTKFSEFKIHDDVNRALSEMGFEEATPIQVETIPLALEGKDLIGQAQTGTGKTAAFGIPIIEHIVDNGQIQAVILAPTRELAVQVAEEINRIAQYRPVSALPIYGGQDINRQIRALKKRPQIIVATPGRFMDHMRRKTIRLNTIHTIVLDEADEMLNMGFIDDIKTILKETPDERQTLLFSATMPRAIQEIARNFMKDPQVIRVKTKEMTVPNIEQHYIELPERQKFDVLSRLLDIQSPDLAIVFGRTKRRVDELSEALHKRGYAAEGIHGDLNQAKRDTVLRRFKSGAIEVLVATDVAARGLDISGVTHVYNFDVPQDAESYVHRVGRTGRAGKTGLATSFVTPREMDHLRAIEKLTQRKMDRQPVPSFDEILEEQQKVVLNTLLETATKQDTKAYKALAQQLLESVDSVTLVSAAIKLLTPKPNTASVTLTAEAPVRSKKRSFDNKSRNRGGGGNRGGGNRGRGNQESRGQGQRNQDSKRGDQSSGRGQSNRSRKSSAGSSKK